ncbi:MAG: hypothetical protein ACI9KE_002208 [Polyangiales bacterium]|jgi:hypothetical protein
MLVCLSELLVAHLFAPRRRSALPTTEIELKRKSHTHLGAMIRPSRR